MVFQHFSLFDALTVTQNIALALKGERNMAVLAGRIETVSADYGLPLRPGRARRRISRSASANASRSCAACCRSRAC